MKQERKETFSAVVNLSIENSFGTIKEAKKLLLEITLCMCEDGTGYFEWWSDTNNDDDEEDQYAEGSLKADGMEMVDYDGVFSLPTAILEKLESWGYNIDNINA